MANHITPKADARSLVFQQSENGKLIFGKVIFDEFTQNTRIQWENHTTPIIIGLGPHSSNSSEENERVENNTYVYDKLFEEGELIRSTEDGRIGQIIHVECLASPVFNYKGNKFIVSDIPLSRILPITNTFPGVRITYKGWIGEIVNVKKEFRLQFSDALQTICQTKASDFSISEAHRLNKIPPRFSSIEVVYPLPPLTYPYVKGLGCKVHLPGHTLRYNAATLKHGNWTGFTSWKRTPFVLAWHFRTKDAKFLLEEVSELKINWKHRYTGTEEMPSPILNKNECKLVKTLYIFPHEYIREGSLEKFEILEADMEKITREEDWGQNFINKLNANTTNSQEENIHDQVTPEIDSTAADNEDNNNSSNSEGPSAKRAKIIDTQVMEANFLEFPPPRTILPVELHSLKHELTVKWENQTTSTIMATKCELRDESVQLLDKIHPQQKFIMCKSFLTAHPKKDYLVGVNLGPAGENMINVCWVRKNEGVQEQHEGFDSEETPAAEQPSPSTSASAAAAEQPTPSRRKPAVENPDLEDEQNVENFVQELARESTYNLTYHNEFCSLKLGDVVVRSDLCLNPDFEIGMVCGIKFDGKILIQENNESPRIHFWPFEIRQARPEIELVQPCSKSPLEIANLLRGRQNTLETYDRCNFTNIVPPSHYFFNYCDEVNEKEDAEAAATKLKLNVTREYVRLRKILPENVWFRGYDDRKDLHSLLIIGPPDTPFEGIPFTFDVFLPNNYFDTLPLIYFNQHKMINSSQISPYVTEDGFVNLKELHPPLVKSEFPRAAGPQNIYTMGSIINAMHERIFKSSPFVLPEEIIDPEDLNQIAKIALKNQQVVIASVDNCLKTILNPPLPWGDHLLGYFNQTLPASVETYRNWNTAGGASFPLLPGTEGFNIAFNHRVQILNQILEHLETPSN